MLLGSPGRTTRSKKLQSHSHARCFGPELQGTLDVVLRKHLAAPDRCRTHDDSLTSSQYPGKNQFLPDIPLETQRLKTLLSNVEHFCSFICI